MKRSSSLPSPLKVAFGVAGLWASFAASGRLLHPAVFQRPGLTLACLGVAAAVVLWPALEGVRDRVARGFTSVGRLRFGLALWLTGCLTFGWLAQQLFQGAPHLADSVAALFSAELLISGRLTAPMPSHPEFFRQFGVLSVEHGVSRLAGMYPPGWALALAPGVAAGASWLVNPVLGGALAVATTALGTELYDRRIGRLAGLLVVTSPLLGVFAATHLSHLPTALGLTIGWWAVIRIDRTAHLGYGLVAGGALGLAFLTRPATAGLVGLAIALLPLSRPRRSLERWRAYGLVLALLLLSVLLLAGYQLATTGDPLTPGHRLVLGPERGPGFGQYAEGQIHDPARGLKFTRIRVRTVDFGLLGWPVTASVVLLFPFLLGRAGLRELWLLTPYAALLAFFSTFWYFPAHYPGRYVTSALPALLIGCAAAWGLSARSRSGRSVWTALPTVVVLWGLLFALLVGRPVHFSGFGPHHADIETVLPAMIEQAEISDALVFVSSEGWWARKHDQRNDYYGSAFRLNSPDLDGDIVFARDLGAENARLIAEYPGRRYYSYTFQRGTRQGRLLRLVQRDNGTWRRIPIRRRPS